MAGYSFPNTAVLYSGWTNPVTYACSDASIFVRHQQTAPVVYIAALLSHPYVQHFRERERESNLALSNMSNALNAP